MKAIFSILSIVLFLAVSHAKWDPNAGYIPPYTHTARIYGSSGSGFSKIVDNRLDSFWESTAPLPDNYIGRSDLNIFLDNKKYSVVNNSRAVFAFDGNPASKTRIESGEIEIRFKKPEKLKLLSIKLNTSSEVRIVTTTLNGIIDGRYSPDENYNLKGFEISENEMVKSVKLVCNKPFEIFEIAGLVKNPTEYVIFEFKDEKEIGWMGSKSYNGDGVISISVSTSVDAKSWRKIGVLNSQATTFITQLVKPQIKARYVKVEFELQPKSYQKAILQEFEIYDKYGPFGPPDPAIASGKTFAESFGINAIWGWGYGIPSEQTGQNQGAQRFIKVAKLVRNYHSLDWDIKKPGQNPNYNLMEQGKGTTAIDWVNWNSEYGLWKKTGFDIDVCLMFNNQYFPDTLWKDAVEESSQYADYFGEYFIDKTRMVAVVEIGNEPWEYSKKIYKEILLGMSGSFAKLSGPLTILPCAVQVWDRKNELGNYISNYLNRKNTRHLDGIVTHLYSYIHGLDGERIAVNPEDPRSEVWSVVNLKHFSEINMNSVPVYVTEFGYDSDGGGDDCTHSNCVSEYEQAIYGVRMSLILYRLGVEEFYWYYYANVDAGSVMHNRSGLVSSYSNGMVTKKAFSAFENMQNKVGNLYFLGTINESEESYIYKFGDKDGNEKAIIAWLPTLTDHDNGKWVEFSIEKQVLDANWIVNTNKQEPGYVKTVNGLKIFLTGNPVVIYLR